MILILAEHDGSKLKKTSLEMVTAARGLNPEITVALLGAGASKVAVVGGILIPEWTIAEVAAHVRDTCKGASL